jgi:hypothetical protein
MNDAAEAADVLTAGYAIDLEPVDPYLVTHAQSPYIRLDRQDPSR